MLEQEFLKFRPWTSCSRLKQTEIQIASSDSLSACGRAGSLQLKASGFSKDGNRISSLNCENTQIKDAWYILQLGFHISEKMGIGVGISLTKQTGNDTADRP